jgi:hypothetical protein
MAVFWVVASCNLVEVYQTTRRYNPEDRQIFGIKYVQDEGTNTEKSDEENYDKCIKIHERESH